MNSRIEIDEFMVKRYWFELKEKEKEKEND
jgi:hypothetical protein